MLKEFRVIVEVRVVNSEGEPVDYRGHPASGRIASKSLQCSYTLDDFDTVEKAHQQMNTLFDVNKNIGYALQAHNKDNAS